MAAPRKTRNGVRAPGASVSSISVAEFPQKPQASKAPSQAPFNFAKNTPQKDGAKAATGTQVIAQIDVGFGNVMSIRGQGAGLSWDKGQTLQWTNSAWAWTTSSKENFEFKVLINDQIWAQGENMTAKAGSKVVFKPTF